MVSRLRYVQLIKEDIGHVRVKMLAGMDHYLGKPFGLADGTANCRRFDKLRPRANDGENFHGHDGQSDRVELWHVDTPAFGTSSNMVFRNPSSNRVKRLSSKCLARRSMIRDDVRSRCIYKFEPRLDTDLPTDGMSNLPDRKHLRCRDIQCLAPAGGHARENYIDDVLQRMSGPGESPRRLPLPALASRCARGRSYPE